MIAVLDTSVAVKWYADEEASRRARLLVGKELVAPDLVLIELAHALWKKQRDEELLPAQAREGLRHFEQTVPVLPSKAIGSVALDRAIELMHPVSDCVFLVLAEQLQIPLITSDLKFVQRCAGSPYEKLLISLSNWHGDD